MALTKATGRKLRFTTYLLTMPKLIGKSFLPVAIFLAGFGFLVFEVSWFRMLSLVVGATVTASTIVLVAFMGGFGFGAWYWGQHRSKNLHPGRTLAGLAGSVAVFGLLSLWLINDLLPSLYPFFTSVGLPAAITAIGVFAVAVVVLFVPAFFMGGVLPLTADMYLSSASRLHRGIGQIYAIETLGSTLGGLLTGFWFVGALGQSGTVWLAVLVNLLLALLFFFTKPATGLPVHEPVGGVPSRSDSSKLKAPKGGNDLQGFSSLALGAVFMSGFGVIGLQIVWFRIFRVYMTNSAYTFSLIASMVIAGLFVGSWLYARHGAGIKNHGRMLGRLMLMMAVAAIAGFVVLINLPDLVMFPFESMSDIHLVRLVLIPFLSASLVILPVTMVSGYLFPLACAVNSKHFQAVGAGIGKVMLYNTSGSVAGPLVAAFLLIPLVGAALSVLVFALGLLITAALINRRLSDVKPYGQWVTTGMAVVLVLVVVMTPVVKILPPSFSKYPKEILAYNETTEGTFIVGAEDKPGNNRVLSTYVNNSAVIGSTYDAIKVVKMVGHLPFFAGLPCNDVLVVGFGIGVTTAAVASHREVKRIDCVELVSGLKGVAYFYSDLNHGIERDPRLKVHSGDGRHFLQSTSRKFDLITTDPTHPILGSASLYTREYFQLCRDHLRPGGMISQYLPLHKLLPDDFKGILRTFREVFPECTVWLGHYHAVLLGFTGEATIDFRAWSERMAAMEPDIWFYNNPYALAATLSLDGAAIAGFAGEPRLLTDNHPYTEYCSLRSFDGTNLPVNLAFMNTPREAVSRVFVNIPDAALMQQYIEGNRLMTAALALMLQGDRHGFSRLMQQAMVINPDNQEFPFMMKLNMN